MAFILLLIQTLVQTVLADKKNMTLFNLKMKMINVLSVLFATLLPDCLYAATTQGCYKQQGPYMSTMPKSNLDDLPQI